MKHMFTLTNVLAVALLSTKVAAILKNCGSSSDIYSFEGVDYSIDQQDHACVKVWGDMKRKVPLDAAMSVEFEHDGKQDGWSVSFFSDLGQDPTSLDEKTDLVTPCFFLPSSFGPLQPGSQVTVKVKVYSESENAQIFCVGGTMSTV